MKVSHCRLSALTAAAVQVAESTSILEAAAAVQQELAAAMRDVLKDGVVFVLPALPAVPPSQR